MNNTTSTYFELLRSALWETPVACNLSPENQSALWRLAAQQGTAALIFDRVLSLPPEQRPDTQTQAQMKQVCAQNMLHQENMFSVLRRTLTALDVPTIKPVLLKGFTLARLYPKPYLRQWGDIDVFVGKEAYHEGAKLLREAFPEAALFDEEKDYYKHYNLTLKTTAIEMHRVSVGFQHPRDVRRYDRLEHEGLFVSPRPITTEYGTWLEPEERFNVLFVFIHSWEHFVTESASLRQLCDLALAIHAVADKTALTEYLKRNLKALRLFEAWRLYAYILVKYLGLPAEQTPLYTSRCAKRAEKLLDILLHPRTQKEKSNKAPKNVLLRKLYTFVCRLGEAREIAHVAPRYALHTISSSIAQSWARFLRGENTRTWE